MLLTVRIGSSVLMLNNAFPEFGGQPYDSGQALDLTLYLPDADDAWVKAVAAGLRVVSPNRGPAGQAVLQYNQRPWKIHRSPAPGTLRVTVKRNSCCHFCD
jgi:hypothetical protein